MRHSHNKIFVAFILVALANSLQIHAAVAWTGVNLAGGEFGGVSVWPATADIDYFVAKGMNIFRIPFEWTRLQPTLGSALSSSELSALDNLVTYATTTKGVYVLLDVHNYARYNGLILGLGLPNAQFADLWTRLANHYKANSKVLFGLMNEPYGMANKDGAQAAVTAIRATGATNYILLEGNGWSGAHSWLGNWYDEGANPPRSNAETMIQVTDPQNRMIYEVHQYFDSDYSGTSATCQPSPVGSATLTAFTNWLRQNNKKGFLGEFGAAQNTNCYTALHDTLQYMQDNSDVWVGWTYWSAGVGWPSDYMFNLQPLNNYQTDRPQLAIMQPYFSSNAPISIPMAPAAPVAPIPPTPPPATCTPGTTNVIYTDSLQAGWDNWSWSSNFNMADTSLKRSGTASISFVPQNFEAIYLARPGDTFSTSSYSGVEFYINGAPNGGQQIRVGFRKNSNEYGSPNSVNVNGYLDGATRIGNTWTRVYVPFSAMQIIPGDNLMAVTIQSDLAAVQARVYVDDVRLVCIGTGAPVATPVAAPIQPPTTPPVTSPVAAPIKPPTTAPIAPPVTPPVTPPVPPPGFAWTGVNLAGGEFGGVSIWPSAADMNYFAGKGMNIFRIPFEWTRLQPILSQPFDATEENGLHTVVTYATVTKGVNVILDPHNFARFGGLILGSGLSNAQFADLWTRLANKYKGNSRVMFGLMNEPNNMPNNDWKNAAQAAINAIRATGATNYILVPGNGWTGAHSWTNNTYDKGASPQKSNAETMLSIQDSRNKLIYEVHQYFDADYSGVSGTCQPRPVGNSTLVAFTNWLRQNNKKGFLAEFGGGQSTNCYNALTDALKYMKANSNVWVGWTAWAAGNGWGSDYALSLQPTNNYATDRPQLAYLLPYLHTTGVTVPMSPVAPYTPPPLPPSPPVATCTVGTTNNIYLDSLQAGWDNWSWATILNMSDASLKRSGSRSISFIPKGFEAVYLVRLGSTFSTSSFSGVEFYINGAPNGGQDIRVGFRKDALEYGYPYSASVNSYLVGATSISNTWTRVYVPFSAMQISPGDSLMGVTIQSNTDAPQARVYVDDIRLVCVV